MPQGVRNRVAIASWTVGQAPEHAGSPASARPPVPQEGRAGVPSKRRWWMGGPVRGSGWGDHPLSAGHGRVLRAWSWHRGAMPCVCRAGAGTAAEWLWWAKWLQKVCGRWGEAGGRARAQRKAWPALAECLLRAGQTVGCEEAAHGARCWCEGSGWFHVIAVQLQIVLVSI